MVPGTTRETTELFVLQTELSIDPTILFNNLHPTVSLNARHCALCNAWRGTATNSTHMARTRVELSGLRLDFFHDYEF